MTSQEMLARDVRDYADTIAAVVAGTYDFGIDDDERDVEGFDDEAECGEDDGSRYDENGNDLSTEYGRLANYFEYVLDVEYRVDAQLRYKGVVVTLACGGPGIYLDTRAGEIRGYWGFSTEAETAHVDRATCRAVDEYFEECYDSARGNY